jgi:hypothetical protein
MTQKWLVVRNINTASAYPASERDGDNRPIVATIDPVQKPGRPRVRPINKLDLRHLRRLYNRQYRLPEKTLSQVLSEIRAIKGMRLPIKLKKVLHETPENHLAI